MLAQRWWINYHVKYPPHNYLWVWCGIIIYVYTPLWPLYHVDDTLWYKDHVVDKGYWNTNEADYIQNFTPNARANSSQVLFSFTFIFPLSLSMFMSMFITSLYLVVIYLPQNFAIEDMGRPKEIAHSKCIISLT